MISSVDTVRKFYDSFRAGDGSHLRMCHDDIEWAVMDNMPSGGTYVGKRAVFEEYFPSMLANFAEFHAITEQFLDAGGHVVVLGRYEGRSKSTGKRFAAPFAHVYSVSDSKITKFRQYTDTKSIQDALI